MSKASVKVNPGGYTFTYPLDQIKIDVSRIIDDRRSANTTAEVHVTSINPEMPGHLHRGRVVLTGSNSKVAFAKVLSSLYNHLPWAEIIEAVSLQSLDLYRQGEPVVTVGNNPVADRPMFQVRPFLPLGQPSVFYGMGGSFKSYFAAFMGLMVQTGTGLMHFEVTPGNVLILDWETSAEECNERLRALCRGLGLPPTELHYRYCFHPLADDVDEIQHLVGELGISLVVVDSAGAACGGDPSSAELTIRLMNALRSLRTTSLVVDHVSKNTSDGKEPTPFGSVYKINYGRSVWEVKRAQGRSGNVIEVGLYHRKVNNGPLLQPIGFGIEFKNDAEGRAEEVHIYRNNVLQSNELSKGMPAITRIMDELKAGKLTVKDLAENLEMDPTTVRARLNEAAKHGTVVKLGDEWALAAFEKDPF